MVYISAGTTYPEATPHCPAQSKTKPGCSQVLRSWASCLQLWFSLPCHVTLAMLLILSVIQGSGCCRRTDGSPLLATQGRQSKPQSSSVCARPGDKGLGEASVLLLLWLRRGVLQTLFCKSLAGIHSEQTEERPACLQRRGPASLPAWRVCSSCWPGAWIGGGAD